jgi:hypothetical protein
MGAVFKKVFTKPLPAGAKIIVRKGQRLAEWKDAKGKTRTEPLTVGKDGADRLVIDAKAGRRNRGHDHRSTCARR